MAGRDRPNAALSPKQRNHRRLPHEDGSLTASGLRFSKVQKLPIEGCCNVFLRKLGSGSAPIFGVEPLKCWKKGGCFSALLELSGRNGQTRTADLPLRRRPLYPSELRSRTFLHSNQLQTA